MDSVRPKLAFRGDVGGTMNRFLAQYLANASTAASFLEACFTNTRVYCSRNDFGSTCDTAWGSI
eukprot:TRINITY_DN5984_c0_g1_i1.p2 TRINITY_DN5984_c0_g1~~TRINITY_DN5984_c0_g1_i1.p2  ORF type:complete len:64 (-),score=9.91 TRINITY_DN5984_c0_g1_i1:338-529(-)